MIEKREWPWVAQQNWQDVLFIHSPIDADQLRDMVPQPLEIDTYNGQAWISIVLFKATHSRLRYMPEILSYPPFHQMNIRTYVKLGNEHNERGIYFFSINTDHLLVKLGGRLASLPFLRANITMRKDNNAVHFEANRLFEMQRSQFSLVYRPKSPPFIPHPDSLPYFLTERYCIWMFKGDTILKAPIFHSHWKLQQAEMTIKESDNLPFSMNQDTFAQYAAFKHSLIHPFEKFGKVSK